MYSQRDEELTILKYAPQHGRFLDVGAFHFSAFSNVRALYERGWDGVLIEPSPECFCGLLKEYENNPRITLVNALVTTDSDALTKFYSSPDAVGTSCEQNYEIWKNGAKFAPIYVPSIPINKVIASLNIKADFVSIDTEGTSFDLLRTINFNAMNTKMVCVEVDSYQEEIGKWFADHNWSVITCTAENFIARKNG